VGGSSSPSTNELVLVRLTCDISGSAREGRLRRPVADRAVQNSSGEPFLLRY
jgi:hypothetical protein